MYLYQDILLKRNWYFLGDELLSVNGKILKGLSVEEAYEVMDNINFGELLCCVARRLE